MSNYVNVKNIHGTSKKRYANSYPKQYNSWLDYWEGKCVYSLNDCACCGKKREVGGHVIKEGRENDRKWYIVPLCKKCNSPSNEEYFSVKEDFLVPVSGEDTSDYSKFF